MEFALKLKYIIDRTTPEPNSGCWLWIGSVNPYGQAKMGGRPFRAHRLAFLLATGESPQVVMHTCDVPSCCNPSHLRAGTHALNVADRHAKGRTRNGTSHGSKRPAAKLSEWQIPLIRAAHAKGRTQRSIALEFGVNKTTIASILSGRAWAHVPDADSPFEDL